MSSSGTDESRRLAGRTVVVTRAVQQSSEMREALEARGARVIELPAIQVEALEDQSELDGKLGELDRYQAIVFGSKNAAEIFVERAKALGVQVRAPIACVGAKTRSWLEANGGEVIAGAKLLEPDVYRAEALAEKLVQELEGRHQAETASARAKTAASPEGPSSAASSASPEGPSSAASSGPRVARVLFPRAAEGRETLIELLGSRGIAVEAPVVYRIVPAAPASALVVAELTRADAFTFLSGETLRAFFSVLPEVDARALLELSTVAVIGPVAAEKARALGVRVDVMPSVATVEALISALAEHLAPREV